MLQKVDNNIKVRQLFDMFDSKNKSSLQIVWKVIVAAVLWTVWLARNEAVFEKKKINISSLKLLINLRTFKEDSRPEF